MFSRIEEKVKQGERITPDEALHLFESKEVHRIGRLASLVAENLHHKRVFFVRNRHINPTNICVNRCRFCAFSRSPQEDGAYELSPEEIIEKIETGGEELREVHLVGGLHPEWGLEYYEDILKGIKGRFPTIHIKGFTAVEVDYLSKKSGLTVKDTLQRLKDAGLDAMPGGGAEIFSAGVRSKLCPEKISGNRWLEIHRSAHLLGIPTNATMLYGHLESYEDRVDHLLRLRELQDETGGFQAFIPLSYHPQNTEIGGTGASGIEDLKTIGISRIFLDNIPHIKAYWIMLGEKLAQVSLLFGADDLEGTVLEERITHAAGARSSEGLTPKEIIRLIRRAGRIPVERDSLYNQVRYYGEVRT
ncbi:MAG: aminofutalosine synthase MqnE [Nitrospirae bacterium]|nr:MAG: aminofutalosine synthase MqnE [Nitrospirota bacterium]